MKDPSCRRAPGAGDVLIASPSLEDPHFARSLVYLHTHGEEGSFGLILNRPLGRGFRDLLPDTTLPDVPLHLGGPVQPDQFLLALFRCHPHTHRFHCELAPSPEGVAGSLEDPLCRIRAFVGYAGWSEGQLEEEIARNDWLWTTTDAMMVAGHPTPCLWELLVVGDYRWQRLREKIPGHPGRN